MMRPLSGLLLWLACLPCLAVEAPPMSGEGYRWDHGHFAVPLEIRDNAGVERRQWPVRSGVPLPVGLVHNVDTLRLVDDDGHEVPCQFAVTSRYWGQDDSVRWALLDFAVDLPPDGRRQVWLTNDRPAAPVADPIAVDETDTTITVTTGGLRATIARRTGQLLEAVDLDGRRVLEAAREDGPVLHTGAVSSWEHFEGAVWNNAGWDKTRTIERHPVAEADYLSGPFRPRSVTIESKGPLHAVIAVEGRHRPMSEGEDVVAAGIYDTMTRLHFYRGQHYIVVEHTIAHTDTQSPRWMYMFRSAGLGHSLALSPAVEVTIGSHDDDRAPPSSIDFPMPPGQSAWLYQYGYDAKTKGQPRFDFGTRDALGVVGLGHGTTGRYVDVSDERVGVTVAIRNAWRDAPASISVAHDRLQISLHADAPGLKDDVPATRPAYDLDFGERSSHEVLLYFHTGSALDARAAAVAEAFEYPLFARAVPAWYSDCEVWPFEIAREGFDAGDVGDRRDPHWRPQYDMWNHRQRRENYNSGGHHASLSSGWLPYLRRGALADLERMTAESQWSITHNPGWAYRDVAVDDSDAGRPDARHDAFMRSWEDIAGFGPKNFYLWRADGDSGGDGGGHSYFNGYKILPDAEHYALFRMFEYWELTGDRRALPAINGFVDWAMYYQHKHLFKGEIAGLDKVDLFEEDPDAMRRGHYARIYAWMLYATLEGYATTGNRQHDAYTLWQLRRMLALLRNRHGQLTRWDVTPGDYLPFLRKSTRLAKLDDLFTNREFHNWDSRVRGVVNLFGTAESPRSNIKTWMEALGVFALHAAYRTYGDERILDGLWAIADYMSHHVLFYPGLGMINQHTSMPNDRLGAPRDNLDPLRHDDQTMAWPVLFHYTGWADTRARYDAFTRERKKEFMQEVFEQTWFWETRNRRKSSVDPPAQITDLRVEGVDSGGIRLAWTSPPDDAANGHAERYFVKYSDRPIQDFAPTDHPARHAEKARIVADYEAQALAQQARATGRQHFVLNWQRIDVAPEVLRTPLRSPDWDNTVAFWMAEHVAGEPAPSPAGTTERFTVQRLTPHNWLGAPQQPGLEILDSGKTYYFAVCSWDEDRNLSRVSNVVAVKAP